MKRTVTILALAFALGGCADGGSSGTGITTASGNVSSVTSALRARSGPTAGIRVTIEGTRFTSDTDPNGSFVVDGDYAGPVGMVFGLPDGSTARLVITVPRGGQLTLADVSVDGSSGQASAAVQSVQFGGLVDSTRCGEQLAVMVSRRTPDDGNKYDVRLGSATVRDSAGNVAGCTELSVGAAVDVHGEIRRQGEVEAESVEVESNSGEGSGDGSGSNSGPGSTSSGSGSGDDGGSSGSDNSGSGGNSGPGGGGSDDGGTSGGTSGPG